MASVVLTVGQISNYIRRLFEHEPLLRPVSVEGEISSIRPSRHLYITLKEDTDALECIMYFSKITDKARDLKIGDKVIFHGIIQAYTPQSKYSLIVNSVEIQGEGDIYKAFEEMKAKLDKEGLFDPKYKKNLPEFPKLIGVVTSENGAAFKDITKTLENRNGLGDILLFPVPVQGIGAGKKIADTINFINDNLSDKVDVLIVGRGGGSPDDLACFNDEDLARAIFNSSIPIISAVGHEIDVSICDFVADARAETPTAAANLVNKSYDELIGIIEDSIYDMNNALGGYIIQEYYKIDTLFNSIDSSFSNMIISKENSIENMRLLLEENDPRKFLDKGYALVFDNLGKPVTKAQKIKSGNEYVITFSDGKKNVTAN